MWHEKGLESKKTKYLFVASCEREKYLIYILEKQKYLSQTQENK